jgi:signal transduction histidine kinase/DNA-binding response OmpR family regulator
MHDALINGGEMGALTREFDWSTTSLGPAEGWPQSLKTAVSIMLGCQYPLLIWWGPDLIHFYNDAYVPVLGKRHPGALGRPAAQVWSEAWPLVGPQADAVMQEGRSYWNEELLIVMTRNGFPEEVFMTFSYGPIVDDDGRVGGVFCACTEETPRVLGRRRLGTLQALADRSNQAKTDVDACEIAADELSRNANDLPFALFYLLAEDGGSLHLAGHSGIEAGTPASPLTIDFEAADAPWPFRETMASCKAVALENLEARFGPLPGGPWPEPTQQALVLPLSRPGQKRLAGFLVAGVSPRLPLDEDYRAFLGLVAAQSATAIANARAYEAERQRAEALAEIDRAKTLFFANVSHEFRTPLTLMLGPLDMLLSAPETLSPSQRDDIEIAHRNALRLLKLVNTLLDFSRIEAGRAQPSFELIDVASLTAELASNFRSAIERAGMRLVVDCPALVAPVRIDRDMWEKIVLNLLSNAFKFTMEGEIAVRLARDSDDHLVLRVSDTGTGISDAELPHLFERFHRVRGARARSHEGSGIGLALVMELVKLHGGTIGVSSEVGRGTTFEVRISIADSERAAPAPLAHSARESTAIGVSPFVEEAVRWLPGSTRSGARQIRYTRQDRPEHTSDPRPSDGRRPTILIADDNADMRDYVRRLLADDYEVESVPDGESALRFARTCSPDLLLVDIMMPGMDGLELLREMRADPKTRHIPMILLSARAGEESKVEGLDAGADDYLVKPFAARELLARVNAHANLANDRRRTADELRARFGELQRANSDIRDARRATLNVLEDAVEARSRAEQLYGELREQNVWINGQREALEAAVNGEPLATSLGILTRVVTAALGEGTRAAFYLADETGKVLNHVVGMGAEYAEAVDGFAIGPESLACGLATHIGAAVITVDVQDDPRWEPWRWLAERFGYRGCWSFPLNTAAGKFIGTMAMYHPRPRDATSRNQQLAALLTSTASIVIARHKEAETRKFAETAFRRSEQQLRAYLAGSFDVVYRMSADWRVMWHLEGKALIANTAEPSNTWIQQYIHPDDQRSVMDTIDRAIRTRSVFELEHRVIRADGTLGRVLSRAIPVLDEHGEIAEWIGTATDVDPAENAT